jgi:phage terminase small subunit
MDDDTPTDDTIQNQPDTPHLTVIDGGAGAAGDGDEPQPKPNAKAKRRKLTAKQERFLAEMIRGATQADAYRAAYNAKGMKPSAIYTEAGRVMANPEVSRRLHAHQDSVERSAASSALSRRRFVLEGLERESTEAASDSARVAALIALGKTSGVDLFTDRVEQVADQSPDEVRAALEQRLAALLGSTG